MSTESTNKLINIVGLNTFLTNLKENTLSNYAKNDDVIDQDTIEELIQNSIISNPDNDSIELKDIVTGIKINGIINTPNNGIVELGVTGNYNKPSNGIPVSDLDSSIQTTLNKVRINEENINTINSSIENLNSNFAEIYNKTQKIYYINNINELNEVYPLNIGFYIVVNGDIIIQNYDIISKCVYQLKLNSVTNLLERRYQIINDTNNKTISSSWTEWNTSFYASTVISHVKDAINNNTLITNGYNIVNKTNESIATINPNEMNIFGIVDSLTISFEDNIDRYRGTKEYLFQFESGETPTRLALPADIKWVNGEFPVIEANYTYQVSVLNNCASIMKFKTV